MTSVGELSEMMRSYTRKFSEYVARKDYDSAIQLGLQVLEKLLKIASEEIIANISDPSVAKIGQEILKNYESTLSYVSGVMNGLKYVSPIYALGEKEQLVGLVASSVSELFNFIMGALLIVASIQGRASTEESFGVV
ncbi:MAG: hypothetical protein ACP5II_07505 [Infirmifilum sp.]|jgi:ribosomal protein S20|uniref:Uncharacterized protein n=1 Tax=Infirmifilum uzonense TaxID=1550241 RepID=A0A0F7CLB8_9CREN|nr:hypothetical protein [Infirmifilum uzonense]AKG39136.1 hypothetical protein MA03_07640 [Infirmifilum uzonense]